ncbi:hypothetical protein HNR00_001804 [Methylorubrum rhodinum]|uniref:Uncharacterized protein n=1 Tax=Methylorubrum rhodinum TaxID=29428 RepID=A0A840ZHP9_9HYPH|nr:hypothetical protein [Methylorubrum rhodinum]MBB5757096.1 hypothetical protein [Methylorubrum rhodinum]
MTNGRLWAAAFLVLAATPADAADLLGLEPMPGPQAPRFFPRAEGDSIGERLPPPRRLAACAPRVAPVPTDAPDDPSYVGSAYGLGKPSYYGFRPGLGFDDPFGRPLRYCP